MMNYLYQKKPRRPRERQSPARGLLHLIGTLADLPVDTTVLAPRRCRRSAIGHNALTLIQFAVPYACR